ncbi:hypothetical protein CDD83_9950 [Cordyceps sp. RAO-2017]|nr:hypothetical protein CDD83_9950 [Cordyceps sp. RAO-2017]
MTLFEPFLNHNLSTDLDPGPSPRMAFYTASKFLQTLLRLYYLRHGFESTDVFLTQPLARAGFMCLDAIQELPPGDRLEAARSTLFLAAKGLYDQGQSHRLAKTLFLVVSRRMRPEEEVLMREIPSLTDGQDHGGQAETPVVHSKWPVDTTRKTVDIESKTLTSLVKQLDISSPAVDIKAGGR